MTAVVADLFDWLADQAGSGAVVTSLPDADEIGATIQEWKDWFDRAVEACLAASTGPSLFLQTDRKHDGQWISKPALILRVAARLDRPLIWHRIVLRRDPMKVDLHRPSFSHLLAVGPGRPGPPAPDVIYAGRPLWANGAGSQVAHAAAIYLESQKVGRVLNPACGSGAFMVAAAVLGLDVSGCDLDPTRVSEANSRLVTAT